MELFENHMTQLNGGGAATGAGPDSGDGRGGRGGKIPGPGTLRGPGHKILIFFNFTKAINAFT